MVTIYGRKPDKTVWIGLEYFCNENDKYWNMSDEEFIKFATEELEKMNIIKKEDILDSHREKVKKHTQRILIHIRI